MIELNGLLAGYGRNEPPVLRGVDLKLENEKAVIVGPNGCGKSTLFKAVLGLMPSIEGEIRLFGHGLNEKTEEIRVSSNLIEFYKLAMVPCRDIIRIYAEMKGGDPGQMLQLIHDFELDSILSKKIHTLSTGQQKMFGNLMAISFVPKLVLLDEPFDNVDEARRRQLMEILKGIDAEVILITHELDLLSRLDGWSLYFMLDGKLWGKFMASQLERLYLTRGVAKDAIKVMDTKLGQLSVTLDHGDVAVRMASTANALLGKV